MSGTRLSPTPKVEETEVTAAPVDSSKEKEAESTSAVTSSLAATSLDETTPAATAEEVKADTDSEATSEVTKAPDAEITDLEEVKPVVAATPDETEAKNDETSEPVASASTAPAAFFSGRTSPQPAPAPAPAPSHTNAPGM